MSAPHPAASTGATDLRQASRAALSLGAPLAATIERLSQPNGRAFATWTALYLAGWALGVAAVAAATGRPLLQFAVSALLGSQLHALTVLQHDCGHRSAFRSARANRLVGRLLALFVFMPFTTFTELHRRHHGFLGDAGHDPDDWFYEGGTLRMFVREGLFMPRFIVLSLTRLPDAEVRRRVAAELLFNTVAHGAVVVGLLAAGATELLLFAYALPMAWLALVFNPVSRGFEHLPMAALPAGDPRRADLRLNTVTTTSRVVGALWANIGFHVEHHMYPRVPFYRLPALHRLFAGKAYCVAALPLAPLAARGGAAAAASPAPPAPIPTTVPAGETP